MDETAQVISFLLNSLKAKDSQIENLRKEILELKKPQPEASNA